MEGRGTAGGGEAAGDGEVAGGGGAGSGIGDKAAQSIATVEAIVEQVAGFVPTVQAAPETWAREGKSCTRRGDAEMW